MDRIEILGVEIDNVSWEEALDHIRKMIRSGKPHHIVTPAIEQVVRARRDPIFGRMYSEADLVLADGMQIVFASYFHRTPLKARITGVDMVPAICRMAAKEGYRVYFFGGEGDIAQKTAEILSRDIPGLQVAGTYSPPYGFENNPQEEEKAIEAVRTAKPDVLFVAMRSPRMELWIDKNKEKLNVSVSMGIGGAFNFITGREKRAPRWVQALGGEGLYRFFQRPRQIGKRLMTHAPYFFLLLLDRFTYRTQKKIALWVRPVILGMVDAVLAPMCFLFSYWFYFRSGVFSNQYDPFVGKPLLEMPAYSELMLFSAFFAIVSLAFHRLYERDKYIPLSSLIYQVLKASLTTVFLLIAFQFIFKDIFRQESFLGFSRMVFGFFGLAYFLSLCAWRCLFHQFEYFLHKIGINLDRILILGTNDSTKKIAQAMIQRPELGNVPIGCISLDAQEEEQELPIPLWGTLNDLERLLPARKVDEVLIADPEIPMKDLLHILKTCRENRVTLSIIPTIHELLGVSSEIKRIGDFRVITMKPHQELDTLLTKYES